MYKIKLFSTFITLGLLAITSCNDTPKEKLEVAATEGIESQANLDSSKIAYNLELANYRTEATEKITANDVKLQEYKNDIANKKRLSDKEFQKKIAALEVKNADMKKRIQDFVATDRMGWYDFRDKCEYDLECNTKDLYNICNPLMAK
jgi:hypothetical protein